MDGGDTGGGDVDIVDITFGEITGSSSQDQVTGTISTSLERLQAQTQNVINKMTEYKAELQQRLAGFTTEREGNKIIAKITAVTNIIDYENQIKTAQQNRNTGTGRSDMDSYYRSITREIAELLSGEDNQELLVTKISTWREAVALDERNVIGSAVKADKLNDLDSKSGHVIALERRNGNSTYTLPNPETNMSGLILQLETEIKQTLSGEDVLGQYGQYLFYQGQDIAQYDARISDAATLGKTIYLP
jgi:hypothetical protein